MDERKIGKIEQEKSRKGTLTETLAQIGSFVDEHFCRNDPSEPGKHRNQINISIFSYYAFIQPQRHK